MYNVSEQFHEAVFQNSPITRALFQFADGTILTNEDIHMTSGISLMEAVNFDTELTIGACSSSTLSTTVMNYGGLLSGFNYGESSVSLGVQTETGAYEPKIANVTAIKNYGTTAQEIYTGHATPPYLRVNGAAASQQPPFAVDSILIYEGTIVCFSLEGDVWQTPGGVLTISQNDFMKAKYRAWAQTQIGRSYSDGILYEFSVSGAFKKYEYAKLGTFLFSTPRKRSTNLISITAYDKMTLFDVEADKFWASITYPITLKQIFERLCTFVGVPYVTSTFINSTRVVSSNLINREKITAKDILKWIAEAACSYARMSRDGKVELTWFATQDTTIPMTQGFSIDPAEYQVAKIDKLEILNSEVNLGTTIGTGENSYEILNNPFLFAAMDDEVRAFGTPIYERLSAFPAFTPILANVVCDWSIQAGDVISIIFNDKTYILPIYCQTMTWKGGARVVYESTGSETRPVMSSENRYVYTQEKIVSNQGKELSNTVRQGEPYNYTTITYENGVVTKATINGINIEVRMNGQEGFALYANGQYLGGLRVINGKAANVGNILTNDINGNCWAEIGEINTPGAGSGRGIFIFHKSHSETVPAGVISVYSNGDMILTNSQQRAKMQFSDNSIWFSLTNGLLSTLRLSENDITLNGAISISEVSGNDQYPIGIISRNKIELQNRYGHGFGADASGPYYIKNGYITYF